MKKLTIMAACAALLLGGGLFLKANNAITSISETTIEAIADGELDMLGLGENGCWEYKNRHAETPGCKLVTFTSPYNNADICCELNSDTFWLYYNNTQGYRIGCIEDAYKIECFSTGGGCSTYHCSKAVGRIN